VIVLAAVFTPPLPAIVRLGTDVIVFVVGMIYSPLLFYLSEHRFILLKNYWFFVIWF
jgi:hypothetical protein